jgi:hypothetical protein
MNIPNINIVNYKSLYSILYEIKNNLPFSVYNYSNEEDYIKYSNINKIEINNSLFIVKKSNRLFYKNLKIDKNQIFQVPKFPINIYKLVEKINIQLIKQRYNYQSKLFLKGYMLDINSREITKENKKLKLTEREIDTILFLNNKNTPQSTKILLSEVWGYMNGIETHTVETHIYRLRKKIFNIFKDNNFISSRDTGYIIK